MRNRGRVEGWDSKAESRKGRESGGRKWKERTGGLEILQKGKAKA